MFCYFFILYLIQICAYKIMENEISLYPTVGEYYEYDLFQIMYQDAYIVYEKGEQYYEQQNMNKRVYVNYEQRWMQRPKIGNVDIVNQFQEINSISGNQYKSLSSNNTHFGTLSMENEVIIYEWHNQILQQIGSSVQIDTSFICFNIHLSPFFDILVDCYQDDEFKLLIVQDQQYNTVCTSQSSIPIKTKLKSMINDNNDTYIIYAQYYQDYCMLSLFSKQYSNLSQWNNNFIDFDIPIRINPYIYILTQQQILQCTISSNQTFQLQYNFTQPNISNFLTINLYYTISTYSQCDQILLQYPSDSGEEFLITSFWGCTNQIIIKNIDNQYQFNEAIQTIVQNNQYIIFQQKQIIHLYQIGKPVVFQYNNKIETNSLLYFNFDNELFSFNEMIIAYKIQIPSLKINLTNVQVQGNNSHFSIVCFNQKKPQNQNILKINLTILPKNDTNIYVMFNQSIPQYQYAIMNNINTNFFSFSGPFLKFQQNNDTDYFSFSSTTFTEIGSLSYYYLVSQLSIMQNISETLLYFIGYNKSQLQIFYCSKYPQQSKLSYQNLNVIQISVNATSLQTAYSIYPEILIIGLSDNQTIYLYQQQYEVKGAYSNSNQTFEQEILNFLVTQNNIVILFSNYEISIMTLDFENILDLNQEQINQLFKTKTIQFNPQQIVMNTQLQSSFLFINNIYDVIIISLQQNSKPIPIQLIQVNFAIKQINLVNQQLILSYICNNNQSICFQVWNVQNLPKYYYEKNLCEVDNGNNVTIQSDNLFFYVTFTNHTVYIYNPSLPYHMSLYFKTILSSINSIAFQNQNSLLFNQSIIFGQNTFYSLTQTQGMMISYMQSNQYNFTYPQTIYNYSVTSALNPLAIQRTPNQSITYLTNFTVIKNKTISINLTLDQQDNRNNHFSYPINIIVDRQFNSCQLFYNISNLNSIDILQVQQLIAKGCVITEYKYTYNNLINFSQDLAHSLIITSINNQFVSLLNNTVIIILNNNLKNTSQTNINFTQCLVSTSYNYTSYSICQNETSQYLVNFTLNSEGEIGNLMYLPLPQAFSNIFKMRISKGQIFILGEFVNQNQYLYWFNQSNNSFIQLTQEFSILDDNQHNCQDFSVDQFSYNGYEQQNLILILQTIRNQLYYQIIEIKGENIIINPLIYVIIHYCNFQYSCVDLNQFNYVLIIKIIDGKVAVLVTDTYSVSYLVNILINPGKAQQSNYLAAVIRTIPNYFYHLYTGNSFYFGGVLIQQYQLKGGYVMGIYYLDGYENKSIVEPILMQGSFGTSVSKQYAVILNQKYPSGIALCLDNPFIYPFSTQNITCNLERGLQQRIVYLGCRNAFYHGIYNITFNLQIKEHNSRGQIYALLSLIVLMLFYFIYKIISNFRSLKYLNIEVEL
ncbi:unnamed protein product (macronuclear) [Paramecium tetraurelia]|uniref:Transmembrane protein n=1 Tax=Paramecium tetraurelia TaxID=5888 RepID=A0EGB7_PARTE|nr:uncharacterized protein GSPATT00026682001 [Paramecium tetraurelia]CAK94358.1 unnamed protein product [Paramecium tetraurelia]|eukprot:XP_001461731.1 hypothetical protein (macronuclear) [Paramecium tetraurelia strain d4-2]